MQTTVKNIEDLMSIKLYVFFLFPLLILSCDAETAQEGQTQKSQKKELDSSDARTDDGDDRRDRDDDDDDAGDDSVYQSKSNSKTKTKSSKQPTRNTPKAGTTGTSKSSSTPAPASSSSGSLCDAIQGYGLPKGFSASISAVCSGSKLSSLVTKELASPFKGNGKVADVQVNQVEAKELGNQISKVTLAVATTVPTPPSEMAEYLAEKEPTEIAFTDSVANVKVRRSATKSQSSKVQHPDLTATYKLTGNQDVSALGGIIQINQVTGGERYVFQFEDAKGTHLVMADVVAPEGSSEEFNLYVIRLVFPDGSGSKMFEYNTGKLENQGQHASAMSTIVKVNQYSIYALATDQ